MKKINIILLASLLLTAGTKQATAMRGNVSNATKICLPTTSVLEAICLFDSTKNNRQAKTNFIKKVTEEFSRLQKKGTKATASELDTLRNTVIYLEQYAGAQALATNVKTFINDTIKAQGAAKLKKEEADKLAAEKARLEKKEADRLAAEKAEAKRLAEEAKLAEADRIAEENAEINNETSYIVDLEEKTTNASVNRDPADLKNQSNPNNPTNPKNTIHIKETQIPEQGAQVETTPTSLNEKPQDKQKPEVTSQEDQAKPGWIKRLVNRINVFNRNKSQDEQKVEKQEQPGMFKRFIKRMSEGTTGSPAGNPVNGLEGLRFPAWLTIKKQQKAETITQENGKKPVAADEKSQDKQQVEKQEQEGAAKPGFLTRHAKKIKVVTLLVAILGTSWYINNHVYANEWASYLAEQSWSNISAFFNYLTTSISSLWGQSEATQQPMCLLSEAPNYCNGNEICETAIQNGVSTYEAAKIFAQKGVETIVDTCKASASWLPNSVQNWICGQ